MIRKPFISCHAVTELLKAVNNSYEISFADEDRLHFHLMECRDCRFLLNTKGRQKLYGENHHDIVF
jgi:hypothetical protein